MAARAALVVAAHEFVDPKFAQLRSPASDVDALAGVLGDQAVGGFEVETVVNKTSGEIQRKLERFFSDRKPDDLLLLYFSCHGVKDPAGRLYFVTTNTEFDLLRSTGVSAGFVSEQMEYSRSKRIVVLLDCCYSGAFLKGFRARGDDAVAVEQLEGRGRAVITASRATEYAFEADRLSSVNAQPSLFTGAVVEGLATGRADANGDGRVTVDELYDYVYEAVRGKVAGQTPGRWIDVEGDLVVARNPSPPVVAAALPAEILRAVESDMAMQRLGAAYELTAWYQSDDEARRKAAAPVLERLRHDYDERVKAVAAAALSAPLGLRPTPSGRGPVTRPAPAVDLTERDEAIASLPTPAAPPWPSPPGTPPPPASPAPAPAATGLGGGGRPGKVEDRRAGSQARTPRPPSSPLRPETPGPPPPRRGVRPAVAAPAPADAPVHTIDDERAASAAGWVGGLGGVALLLAAFPTYVEIDGEPKVVSAQAWGTFEAFLLFAMATAAAYWILRTKWLPAAALAALTGFLPFATSQLVVALGEGTDASTTSLGPGWILMVLGTGLLAIAGAVAARRLRWYATLLPRPSAIPIVRLVSRNVAAPIAGLAVGIAFAYGTAVLFDLIDDPTGPAGLLIIRGAVVVAGLIFGWQWARRRELEVPILGIGALVLTALAAAYLLNDAVRGGEDFATEVAFAVLTVAALVVPVVAASLEPRMLGVVLLAAWAAAPAASLPKQLSAGSQAELLAAATGAAGVLAVVLWRRARPTT